MSNALQTAVSGMGAYERMLSVTGNNLSNADTTSYKSDRVTFSTMFSRTLDNGTRASETVGGTNPKQVGNGVRVSSIDKDMEAGNMKSTGKEFDVGIDGEGFFVVNDGTSNVFTRDGSFDVDAQNYLVDPATGYRVQRTGITGEDNGFQVPGNSDIKIPYDTVLPNSRTRQIDFSGNLSSGSIAPTTTSLKANGDAYERTATEGGGQAVAGDDFSAVKSLQNFSSGDRVYISGTSREGNPVGMQSVSGGGATTTLEVEDASYFSAGPTPDEVVLTDGSNQATTEVDSVNTANNTITVDSNSLSEPVERVGKTDEMFEYGAGPGQDGRTIQDLLDKIETTLEVDSNTQVKTTLEDGKIKVTSENDGYSRLDVGLSSTAHPDAIPDDFNYTTVGGESTQTTNITVYDAQGSEHSLTATFARQSQTENVWDLVINDVGGASNVGDRRIAGIKFDDSGTYQGITEIDGFGTDSDAHANLDSDVEIKFDGVSVPQTVGVDFGEAGQYDGLTQFGGDSTAGAIEQDGYSSGSLRNVSIGNSGVIRGTFTNGVSLDIAQIGMAVFGNEQGLERTSANYYRKVPATGSVHYTEPNTGRAGKIRQGVLEESNVDVAGEFTNLITAQRGFQINSRTVRVANQMMKELASIAV